MNYLSTLRILSLIVGICGRAFDKNDSRSDLSLGEILPFPLNAPRSLSGGCGGDASTEEMHFDSYMELDCDKATESCDANDFVEMGVIIHKIVRTCNREFPSYTNDEIKSITNDVCEAPIFTIDNSHHNNTRKMLLRRGLSTQRRLGRYTYRGGGTCRRCLDDNYDRRRSLLKSTRQLGDEASPSEMKEAACELANLGDVGAEVCDVAVEQGRKVIEQVDEVKVQLVKPDDVKEQVQKVLDKYEKMLEEDGEANEMKEIAHKACEAATKAMDENDEEGVKDSFKVADEAAEKALDCAEKSEKLYDEANGQQIKAAKKLMEERFEMKKKEVEELIKKAEEEYKAAVEAVEQELKELEDDFKASQGEMSEAEFDAKKIEIEQKKKDRERKKEALKKALDMYKNEIKTAEAYAQKYEVVAFEMAHARNEEEWLEKYIEMLEFVVPISLMQLYNSTSDDGCLDPDQKLDVNVVLEPKATKDDTYDCH